MLAWDDPLDSLLPFGTGLWPRSCASLWDGPQASLPRPSVGRASGLAPAPLGGKGLRPRSSAHTSTASGLPRPLAYAALVWERASGLAEEALTHEGADEVLTHEGADEALGRMKRSGGKVPFFSRWGLAPRLWETGVEGCERHRFREPKVHLWSPRQAAAAPQLRFRPSKALSAAVLSGLG